MNQKKNNEELEIIAELLRSENYVRGIAKKLRGSHSTILRRLNKLRKENVLDYKKEGKNKVFSLKDTLIAKSYILQAELHKLKKIVVEQPELSILFEEIVNKIASLKRRDAKMIILFGSYAKGIAKLDSDIDLYVETKDRNLKKIIEGVHSKIRVKIGTFDIRTPLIRAIIKNHIIIRGIEEFYEKKQFFAYAKK